MHAALQAGDRAVPEPAQHQPPTWPSTEAPEAGKLAKGNGDRRVDGIGKPAPAPSRDEPDPRHEPARPRRDDAGGVVWASRLMERPPAALSRIAERRGNPARRTGG